MAKWIVSRDPFARGEYLRETVQVDFCSWCGNAEKRAYFNYAWWNDGSRKPFVNHYKGFCNKSCFDCFHGS